MFEHLVESTSHKDDNARKGAFLLGTMAIYLVLLVAAGVASIYWYDAHLENQNLELTTLVAPVPVEPDPEPPKPEEQPKQQKVSEQQQVSTVKDIVVTRPELPPPTVKTTQSVQSPPDVRGAVKGDRDNIVAAAARSTFGEGTGTSGSGEVGVDAPPPPPPPPPTPKPTATPAPRPTAPISGGVLNGKAVSLPKPAYPAIARTARAAGAVTVQVTIDEGGRVISARAVSGHPLLQAAAVQAANQARFSPTTLSGQPVKVTGTIVYNFVAQ